MDRRSPCCLLLALLFGADPAFAQGVGAMPEGPDFDLQDMPLLVAKASSRSLAERQSLNSDELGKREKMKLRLTYQPLADGPQFEVGTLGSRKGKMKSKLIHIAMDWTF